jgi:L-ascorbate metabolism protein UlaG (beta-lactamase superfamily)
MTDLKGTTVTWLGHATVLVKTAAGTTILIDPFIEQNPKFPKGFELPEKLDLILATHGHFDHIADVMPVAKKTGAPVVAMYELAGWFESKGVKETIPMGYGGSYTWKDVTLTMTEARHSSGIQDGDKTVYGGEPAGFVLTIENGPVLYHAGDTNVFSDMQLIRDLYAPKFGMLPIGGHFTMDPRGAALAAKFLELDTVLPLHWGTMPQLTGTPEELEKHIGNVGVEVLKMTPGESVG